MVISCVVKSENSCAEIMASLRSSGLVQQTVVLTSEREAMQWTSTNVFDLLLAEFSPEAPWISAFARQLRSQNPRLPILVCAQDPLQAYDAYGIHADGFLLAASTPEAVRHELEYICTRSLPKSKLLTAKIHGGFELYNRAGKPLHFKRSPAKRMMAYLIERNGIGVDSETLCLALWGDSSYAKRDYLKKTIMELHRILKEENASEVLIRNGYDYSLDMSRILIAPPALTQE